MSRRETKERRRRQKRLRRAIGSSIRTLPEPTAWKHQGVFMSVHGDRQRALLIPKPGETWAEWRARELGALRDEFAKLDAAIRRRALYLKPKQLTYK